MSKQTMARQYRKYDLKKDMVGKLKFMPRKKADGLRDPMESIPYEADCGTHKVTVLVAPGQMVNPKRICKKNPL